MTNTALSPASQVAPAAAPDRADRPVQIPKPTDQAALPSGQARLEASRDRIRSQLLAIAHPPVRPSPGVVDKLTGMVKDIPGVELAIDAAKAWWSEHRDSARLTGQASQAVKTPIARKHPGSLLGVAAAAGALLVLLRPWRLLLRPKILFGAISLVATQAIRSRSASSRLQAAMKFAGSSNRSRP